MNIRFLPLLLLLVYVTMGASQDSISVGKLPNRDISVFEKCSFLLVGKSHTVTKHIKFLPLNTICHSNIQKYFDCVLENVYKSNVTIDIFARSITNYNKIKAATKSICQKAHELKKIPQFCNVKKCKSDFRPSVSTINKDSPLFCQMVADRRCEFNELAKCDLKMAMLWAKYQEEAQSIGCLVSDPMIQLVPTNGPELKCYSAINISDIKHTDYSQIYERYCDQFNYSEVSSCVEKTLSNVTSEELWEDKESYINKARKFVNDRQTLCRNLTALSNLKCLNPAYNFDNCPKMFFTPTRQTMYNASESVKYFAYCIWLSYLDCNLDFGDVIYHNLISYFV